VGARRTAPVEPRRARAPPPAEASQCLPGGGGERRISATPECGVLLRECVVAHAMV
jgi:hypothetical protein